MKGTKGGFSVTKMGAVVVMFMLLLTLPKNAADIMSDCLKYKLIKDIPFGVCVAWADYCLDLPYHGNLPDANCLNKCKTALCTNIDRTNMDIYERHLYEFSSCADICSEN